jgi:uncharacterized membrane protein
MKKLLQPIGAAALTGLTILLPLLLMYMLLDEVLGLIVALAAPVADLVFPPSVTAAIEAPVVFAIVLLFLVSILIGLAAKTRAGRRFGSRIERNTVEKLPVYAALKGIGKSIVGGTTESGFEPVLVNYEDGSTVIAFLVERIDDERVAILEPWVPTPFAGNIKIVPSTLVSPMQADLAEVTAVLSRWGIGLRAVLNSPQTQAVQVAPVRDGEAGT